jgi:hypothetical protein
MGWVRGSLRDWSTSNCREVENMSLYPHSKSPYPQVDPYRPDKFKCLYSRISLIWHPQNWRGARFLNVPFIKQHLH